MSPIQVIIGYNNKSRIALTVGLDGVSSLFFAFADLVIHSIFNTDPRDPKINKASSYLDLSPLYGSSDKEVDGVRR